MDRDYCLALQLQEQFDNEANDVDLDGDAGGGGPTVPWKPEKPLSIVDASWETLDPTPDLRAMFLEFNDRFFWGKLSGVEVKWSHRMTLCAGLCSYEGRGGLCSIRLSEPLLKLRPRKDFVETLLHEMIHALLFVTQNNRDRDGHGPEFVKHMNRINKESGTSITVYHNFNDEVDVYRQHWWRCDGPCRTRGPYFGFVKRSMNRAPSALDPWWEDHRRTCGGNYTKVKEPEGYGKKGGKKGANVSPIGKPAISGTRQDVKAFSGRGFVLGGKPPSASDSPGPSSKSSGRPDTPFPPARAGPAVVPAAPQKRKITKTSVANTKAFVNVNGSPVKISEFHGGRGDDDAVGGPGRIQSPGGTKHVGSRGSDSVGGGRGAGKGEDPHRLKQTSIGAFFNNTSAMSSIAESPTRTLTSVTPPAPMNHPNDDTSSSSASPVERPGGASAATPTRKKKRPPGESSDVFELFSKKLKTDPEEAEESAASRSYAASSPSAVLMVRCPACQARVPESNINEHLDSCLC